MIGGDLRIRYDRGSDALHITTPRNAPALAPALAHEGRPGLPWRHAVGDGDLVGVTVMDLDADRRGRLKRPSEELASRFHVNREDAAQVLEGVH